MGTENQGVSPDFHSMTGFGSAVMACNGGCVSVEVKSVNGRFFKMAARLPGPLSGCEIAFEARVRRALRRGSVSLSMRLRGGGAVAVVIDEEVVRAYREAFERLGLAPDSIPTLPGVVTLEEHVAEAGLVEAAHEALASALEALLEMRQREGHLVGTTLLALCARIADQCAAIAQRAPQVVQEYRNKLTDRVEALLGGAHVPAVLDANMLAREVAIYADRCDIGEELDRLCAHVEQFRARVASGGDVGRSLDFLVQEMNREINTIGSKSADVAIAQRVVDLKADLERLKEHVANIA